MPVRSVGSGQRLLDVVELLAADPRLRIVFSKVPSIWANGVDGLLGDVGVTTLDWDEAGTRAFDLVITASRTDLRRDRTPVLVIPGACGRRRVAPRPHGERVPAPRRTGSAVLLTAHSDDLRRIGRDRTVLAGDLSFDRLTLSAGSRGEYRRALRVPAGRRLVVVVSAWGRRSLIVREPTLLHRFTDELAEDRYRVAVLIHPMAWFSEDVRHLNAWMTTARTASVQVVDPFTEWRPVVAAADLVVGDHGSITLYSAGAGLPVLSTSPVRTGSTPTGRRAAVAHHTAVPRLRPDLPLPSQVDAAHAAHSPHLQRHVSEHITSVPGQAARRIRARIYRMLRLPPPSAEPMITPIRGPRRMI
ncbi:hypothetical protein ACFFQW_25300 [Umezawaea endophytica]|uniref:CDP-glycerol:poly(Glycerophosphate) glycerophosphotransferase n=1 Tax=Umezawaea endophytica TaxID=1654476 RepID=A0A9X2VMW4_9PSEU|nr:hypothetical protein [Umezawaea endophytica]MCS7479441.1 hypothetical protein [Umezawaea endophytica]